MTTIITAHEARVRTATVEIKSLTVSGKQVTLSVFRQIPYEHIIATSERTNLPQMLGLPWGTVNYFWQGCVPYGTRKDYSGQLHVVWQSDDALYRSVISQYDRGPFTWSILNERPLAEAWTRAYKQLYAELAQLPQLFIAV